MIEKIEFAAAAATVAEKNIKIPKAGLLRLRIVCDRPLKLWFGRHLLAEDDLHFRLAQREMTLEALVPVKAESHILRAEFGEPPTHMPFVDRSCPSRNRAELLKKIQQRYPGKCRIDIALEDGTGPAVCLRFGPAQIRRDGMVWQELVIRELAGFAPLNREMKDFGDMMQPARLNLSSAAAPNLLIESAPSPVTGSGCRRFYLPVTGYGLDLPSARETGAAENRLEPGREPVGSIDLLVEDGHGAARVAMPAYESAGKGAPAAEYRHIPPPLFKEIERAIPRPSLPDAWKPLLDMYYAAWKMLCDLWREPGPDSGMPGGYLGTAVEGFADSQFVWDTSFTTLAAAYAWRAFPHLASFDCLYSRQEDGGYLHRQGDVRSNLPLMFEPDFSPNPPLMAVVELAAARLSGDTARLVRVYPLLTAQFAWLKKNRRLVDGTYWTTGLANGLDNSPSLGEGYPCLTAQMAHFAESLADIAAIIGDDAAAESWRNERGAVAAALNKHLWDDQHQIYSTSLTDGGHNPNKVVTAFWPLWADLVPSERVANLVEHALDPNSFNRHHPLPSLAADSPSYDPGGGYWRGSIWTPTNFAAIKGLWRSGAREAARTLAMRHLQCMAEVHSDTGVLWENYCPEKSERGSISCRNYSWTAVSPVALLLEVVLGLEPDAVNRRLTWRPWPGEGTGVRDYPLGPCTISLAFSHQPDGCGLARINTDLAFTLEIITQEKHTEIRVAAGYSQITV